jgi:hypothetical protein
MVVAPPPTWIASCGALGLPALVFNDKGKVLAANQLIEALTGIILWHAHDRAGLTDRAADELLKNSLATINAINDGCVRSFRFAMAMLLRLGSRMSFRFVWRRAIFLNIAWLC